MKLLIPALILISIVALYVIWGRKWLKAKTWPWSMRFFELVEPIEIVLWKKSETILWARFKVLVGLILTALTFLGQIDLTPIMPFVPDAWEPTVKAVFNLIPLSITIIGMIDEKLRNGTSKPLELVAVPDNPPMEVAIAVEQASSANKQAVATVAADKGAANPAKAEKE
jgi:hypothetical protein